MQLARESERGQALTETAVFMPLFLLVLFGLLWVVQFSVVNERAQIAVRYSGLISNESSPYQNYSLYAVYANVGAVSQGSSPAPCVTPPADAFSNDPANGAFPGPVSQPFWVPESPPTGSCGITHALVSTSMSVPMLLSSTSSSVTVQKQILLTMPSNLGGLQSVTMNAQQNFFDTPDVGSLMKCFPDIGSDVSATLSGEQSPSLLPAATAELGATNQPLPLRTTPC